ncbi:hypothetical protein Trydic_g8545 [Trypoxylus dichotomus]
MRSSCQPAAAMVTRHSHMSWTRRRPAPCSCCLQRTGGVPLARYRPNGEDDDGATGTAPRRPTDARWFRGRSGSRVNKYLITAFWRCGGFFLGATGSGGKRGKIMEPDDGMGAEDIDRVTYVSCLRWIGG